MIRSASIDNASERTGVLVSPMFSVYRVENSVRAMVGCFRIGRRAGASIIQECMALCARSPCVTSLPARGVSVSLMLAPRHQCFDRVVE